MSFSTFELECLEEHNRMRERHGCPPLELDRYMCDYAAQWAQNLAARHTLKHRPGNRYGENLYVSHRWVNGATAVRSWYAEIANYRRPVFSPSTGHFTQVVWCGSRKLGVAMATSGGAKYVVANYYPPGNYRGRFEQNVPPVHERWTWD